MPASIFKLSASDPAADVWKGLPKEVWVKANTKDDARKKAANCAVLGRKPGGRFAPIGPSSPWNNADCDLDPKREDVPDNDVVTADGRSFDGECKNWWKTEIRKDDEHHASRFANLDTHIIDPVKAKHSEWQARADETAKAGKAKNEPEVYRLIDDTGHTYLISPEAMNYARPLPSGYSQCHLPDIQSLRKQGFKKVPL